MSCATVPPPPLDIHHFCGIGYSTEVCSRSSPAFLRADAGNQTPSRGAGRMGRTVPVNRGRGDFQDPAKLLSPTRSLPTLASSAPERIKRILKDLSPVGADVRRLYFFFCWLEKQLDPPHVGSYISHTSIKN